MNQSLGGGLTLAATKRAAALTNSSQKNLIDFGDDQEGDAGDTRAAEIEGRDTDPDALAFIHAKRKVDDL